MWTNGDMRAVVTVLLALMLAACSGAPSRFKPLDRGDLSYPPDKGQNDLIIALPAGLPSELGRRVVTALAVELQSYGLLAAVEPASASLQLVSIGTTRAANPGIEIEIEWRVQGGPKRTGSTISRTRALDQDYASASDHLISRIAQQAAPRIATLMGRPPTFEARAPGQVAAGLTVPESPSARGLTPGTDATTVALPLRTKVMVAAVTGAPSDGNRQLFSGMRRALGSNRIVVIDKAGSDTFTVIGTVKLAAIDDRTAQLAVTWVLKDPAGKDVGKVEQGNPVPLAATKGSWAGFGDIVASAAVEGVLELLDKTLNKGR